MEWTLPRQQTSKGTDLVLLGPWNFQKEILVLHKPLSCRHVCGNSTCKLKLYPNNTECLVNVVYSSLFT